MRTEKKQESLVRVYSQHWIVRLWFDRPDEITVKTHRLYYERRRWFKRWNDDFVHPRASTTITSVFAKSMYFTWLIILPVWLMGLLFGQNLPFWYRTIHIRSEAGENTIHFVSNSKQLVRTLINDE